MAAAGGGEGPRRPPAPAHMYGPYKKLLLGIFDDMDNGEYKIFKHHLDCVVSSDNVSIPKARIMRAKRHDMPDLILRYIPRREALEVVARILQRDLPNVQLLGRIRQFTHPEPGTAGYIVMQVKHAAESEEDYLRKCQDIADVLDRCSPGLGNLILEEVRHRECVLVKYLLYIKELPVKRPVDIIQKMSSQECKEKLHRLGVIYITIEDATLFTGELHIDPRTWDPVEVTQWVARTLLPRQQTATIPDLQMTGAEICARPETWFTDKFPPGLGRVLYSDLQQRRDDVAHQRMFGDDGTTERRVTEGTRAAFLVMAFQICMIFYLLGKQLQKASKILEHLYLLVKVVERRAGKNKVDPDLFREGKIQQSIKSRTAVDSTQVTLGHGSKCIAITDETNSKAVTTLCEAMNVIGADLTIKFKISLWKKVAFAAVVASSIGLTAGWTAVLLGESMGVGAAIGGITTLVTVAAILKEDHEGNEKLLLVYSKFLEAERKTMEFEANYLKAVLLVTKIVDRSDLTKRELERVIESVKDESHESVIKQVESALVDKLPHICHSLQTRLMGWSGDIHEEAKLDYQATAWLHDDSVKDVNDSILIAYLQFGMRNLLRDVFILGVIGPENNSKKGLMKLVFPNAVHSEIEHRSCDIVMYDGSKDMQSTDTLPVMLFPSGKTKVVEATLGLWISSCSAFIFVVDYTPGIPDLKDLEVVDGLCVPVFLCINTKGRRLQRRQAETAIDTYKSGLSYDLRDLVQVILVDVSDTDKSPWITRGGDVKYWVQDVLDHHQELACNMIDKAFKDSL